MTTFSRLLLLLAALASIHAQAQAPTAQPAGKPAVDEINRLVQDYAFDKAAARAPASSGAVEDDSKRFHEYRMQMQKDKVTFAFILGAAAVMAHVIVLGFLYRRSPEHIVGATGLVYIVFGTILLVVIANTDAQLTAAIGVLGAIAGYLFGRLRAEDEERKPSAGAAGGTGP